MRRMKDKIEGSITNADEAAHASKATSADNVPWSGVQGKPSTYTPSTHTHTKSQITDFPTSMPASDVYSWAKASSKPNYTKAEVGLSNVDNTADKDKSVKSASSADAVVIGSNVTPFIGAAFNEHPKYVLGVTNDLKYVNFYDPSYFVPNKANFATAAAHAAIADSVSNVNVPYSIKFECSYIGDNYQGTNTNPLKLTLSDNTYDFVLIVATYSTFPTINQKQEIFKMLVDGNAMKNCIKTGEVTTAYKSNLIRVNGNYQSQAWCRWNGKVLERYANAYYNVLNDKNTIFYVFGVHFNY